MNEKNNKGKSLGFSSFFYAGKFLGKLTFFMTQADPGAFHSPTFAQFTIPQTLKNKKINAYVQT